MKTELVVEEGVDGELYIRFPDEVLENLGWVIGDTINWDEQPGGSFLLTKVKET